MWLHVRLVRLEPHQPYLPSSQQQKLQWTQPLFVLQQSQQLFQNHLVGSSLFYLCFSLSLSSSLPSSFCINFVLNFSGQFCFPGYFILSTICYLQLMKVLDLNFQFLYAHLFEVEDMMIEDDGQLLLMLDEVVLMVLHRTSVCIVKVVYLGWTQYLNRIPLVARRHMFIVGRVYTFGVFPHGMIL